MTFEAADAMLENVDVKGWVRTSCWEASIRASSGSYAGKWGIRYRKRASKTANSGARVWVPGKSALFDSKELAEAQIVHYWAQEEKYKGHVAQLRARDAAETEITTSGVGRGDDDDDEEAEGDDEGDGEVALALGECEGEGEGEGDPVPVVNVGQDEKTYAAFSFPKRCEEVYRHHADGGASAVEYPEIERLQRVMKKHRGCEFELQIAEGPRR